MTTKSKTNQAIKNARTAIDKETAAKLAAAKEEFAAKKAAEQKAEEDAAAEDAALAAKLLEEYKAAKAAEATIVVDELVGHDKPAFTEERERKAFEKIMGVVSGLGLVTGNVGWKRQLIAFIVSSTISMGAGYLIGVVASMAIVAVATLAGAFVWQCLIMFVALMLALYAGLKSAQTVGKYITSGDIDRDVVNMKNKVVGFFKTTKEAVATKPAPNVVAA